MERRSFAAAMAIAVLVGVAAISLISHINVPGVSKIIRPTEAGTGTRCAEGDEKACKQLCSALSNVSTIKCVDHLARVFPRVKDGGVIQAGAPPGQQPGGRPSGPSPSPPKPAPPPTMPPPTTPTTPPPTTTTGPVDGITHLVCHLNPLGIRVCIRVPVP